MRDEREHRVLRVLVESAQEMRPSDMTDAGAGNLCDIYWALPRLMDAGFVTRTVRGCAVHYAVTNQGLWFSRSVE